MRFDPMVHDDGTPVTTDSWERRRREMGDAIVPHEYGGRPPAPTRTTAVRRYAGRIRDTQIAHETWEVRAEVAGGEICFDLRLWIPPGTGDKPVVLDGDGCWRYLNDDIVGRVVARGNIAASFDRTALAADEPDHYRDTGLYRLLPEATFGALSAWAWGYHRCVDVLQEMEGVRGDAIAITGHSRGGKTVLLAGATDARIGLTNPNDSGTGGSGPNHRKAAGAEVVADFFRSRNIFWFGQDFAAHRDRDGELPYEQHYLHALVAPRHLLVTEAYEDAGANPPGSYASCQAVLPVYTMLEAASHVGWAFREGGHGHQADDFEALLACVDRVFHARQVRRDFQRALFPDLEALLRPV